VLGVQLALGVGCATQSGWVTVRNTPRNPLASTLQLLSKEGPKESSRTAQVLRRYALEKTASDDLSEAVQQLVLIHQAEPNREIQYSIAELAYIAGKRNELLNRKAALSYYGTSILYSYDYLFDDSSVDGQNSNTFGSLSKNPYDPQFREACDLYNQSLEATLRLVQEDGLLRPGSQTAVKTVGKQCSFEVELHSSGWHEEDFDNFQFVSDYQLAGLRNHYHTYGLGVPLIAQRRSHEGELGVEQFYPDKLTFPLTAFLRIEHAPAAVEPNAHAGATRTEPLLGEQCTSRFVLELHDPLDRQTVAVGRREVALESDLSTPLAYFLNQPDFEIDKASTRGLLNPSEVEKLQGLYMLEPFDPNKMPVVMVHGLWSSPVTWMEMFNDLRSDPYVRQHYQFWFYLYPTGQPFWISAAQMRGDLDEARNVVDPAREKPALDQTVLVGHSMGGLVSKLQSIDSGNRFWATLSDQDFKDLKVDAELREELSGAFFFQPSPAVRRVVTIATPHSGSNFSNRFTRWAGNSLIRMPMRLVQGRQAIIADNKDYFRPDAPLDVRTSLDSLSPSSVLLTSLREAEPGPWVTYHNIVGKQAPTGIGRLVGSEGDGVVSLESARLDGLPNVKSQLVVESDHQNVHRHPQSVLEVRRILVEQLGELQQPPWARNDVMMATATTDTDQSKQPRRASP